MESAPVVPQHVSALARANAIRGARTRLMRRVASGELTVRDVLKVHELPGVRTLEDVDACVASMMLGDLLTTPHRWGVVRMRNLLADVRIGEHVPVGALTSRQRRRIVAAMEERLAQTDAAERHRAAREALAHAEALRDDAERDRLRALGPLGVECPSCRSRVGDVCSTYDPVHDRWHEPPTHPKRYDAAGIKRP